MSKTEAGRLTATKPDRSDGLSFQAVIEAARRLDELSCARVVGQAAEAVHAAQKGGQPLGAVTPAAIVVLPDGKVRLAAGTGSARYTAPEKLRGGAGDRRTDVFSLGVVLWEALAHEPLFEGASDEAVKRAVLGGGVRPPSEYNANVPAELDAICQRALAAEPANRYQSAKVMAAEIDAVLGDAGYPESNEAIASYVARALAAEAGKLAPPGGRTAPLPVVGVAPASRPVSKTLQPMSSAAAPPPASRKPPHAASRSANASQATASSTIQPVSRSSRSTQPPAKAAAPANAATPDTLRSSSAMRPPAASTNRPSSGSRQPAAAGPPSAGASVSESGESVWTEADPPTTIDAKAPAWDDVPVKTEVRGSMYPAAGAARSPTRSALASTAFLGSNAIDNPGGAGSTHIGVPPAVVTPGPSSRARHASDAEQSSFAAPEMPALRGSPPADPKHTLPAPFRPGHPQPPLKESIATAATAETPHLGAELPAAHASTQRGLAPGMMIAPASPSAALPTADTEFEDERHADPAEVIALQHPEKGRDVLAGWGWSTGTTEAITDDEDIHDTTRAGRKRLVITIGAALAVVAAIAVVAFAFRGSKPPSDDDATAQRSPAVASATAAPGSPAAPVADPATTAPSPGTATAATPPATTPPATEPKPGSDPAPAVVVDPPKPAIDPASPVVVDPPRPAVVDPPRPAVVDPPRPAVVDPPRPAIVDPPKPAIAAPVAPPIAAPPRPPVVDPPKPVAAPPKPAAKHDPPKVAVAKPPEPAKPVPHKPPEPKKPVDSPRHAPPPERVARAQPIDPYGGAPDKPRVDPAAAYKSGLQQYARGDTSGALATFRGSLSSNPGYAPTWRGIGLVYEKLGNKGQARSAFKRYLLLSPGANDADQIRDRLERLGS